MTNLTKESHDAPTADPAPIRGFPSLAVLAGVLVLAVALRPSFSGLLDEPAVQTWTTVFVSLVIQAVPFLVLGVVVSAAISVLVPPSFFARALPGGLGWRCPWRAPRA